MVLIWPTDLSLSGDMAYSTFDVGLIWIIFKKIDDLTLDLYWSVDPWLLRDAC